MKARKKQVEIEFEIWSGVNFHKIKAFVGHVAILDEGELYIQTLEGYMLAKVRDYIIKGVNGEYYPCKPDIFEKTYDIIRRRGEVG